MSTLKIKDGDGVDKYLLGEGVGTSGDPFIPSHQMITPTTPSIDFFFNRVVAVPTTVAANVATITPSVLLYDVDVVDSTGCTIGDYFGIFNADSPTNNRAYFGTIMAISVGGGSGGSDRITLDTPIDFSFVVGDTAACLDREMNGNGSVTPLVYNVQVGQGATQSILITRLMISMYTNGAVDLGKFGDLTSLTNGCVLRRVNGIINNMWNVKNNGELANITFDYEPFTAGAQGQDGAKWRNTFAGLDKHDTGILLEPGDELQFIVQDNLTGLDQFRIMAQGRYLVT